MTHRSPRAHWKLAPVLMSAAVTVALTALSAAPGGALVAQAQACSPQIGIDSPSPGDTVSGTATFTGWAVDLTSPGGSGVDQVRLYRDAPPEQGGTPLAVATVGIDRPDIDAANGLTGSDAGWTADVDFSDSPAGPATVYIYAHTICGWTYATQVVSIDSGNLAGPAAAPASASSGQAINISMDAPTAGAMVNNGQAVNVSGWAVDPSGAGTGVDTVRLFLDGPEGTGQALGFANYGRSRPDVVTATGNSSWDKSGFDLVWPVSGVSAGSHVLYVYAHSTATGQWDYTTVPVTVTSAGTAALPGAAATSASAPTNPNAVIQIEAPTAGSPITGPTVVRGYALDCSTGNAATTVRFYAGTNTSGKQLGTVTVGNSPRDLSTACPGHNLTGSSNAGFTFTVDPQSLAGAQSITVAADTASGPATTTLAFGGAGSANAGGATTDRTCSSALSQSAALSPFTVSCSPSSTMTVNNNAPGAAPNPSGTSSSYSVCAPGYQGGANNPYMATSQNYQSAVQGQGGSAGCSSTGNSNYNSQCNPSYPNANPQYPYNTPCNGSANGYNPNYNSSAYANGYNSGYNPNYNSGYTGSYTPNYNNGYNNGYNPAYNNTNYNAYTSYNGVNYPSGQYYNGQTINGYPYNNGNAYNGAYGNNYPYTNSSPQYGYPYNNGTYYGNPNYNYTGYNYGAPNYGYNPGYGYPNGPAPYPSTYVYNGNAGANYGNPYGYNPGYPNGYPYGPAY